MKSNSPIFIVGPPRSGTTVMRFCLTQHSNLFIWGETNFFSRLYGNRNILRNLNNDLQVSKLVDRLFESGDPTIRDYVYLKDVFKKRIIKEATKYSDVLNIILGEISQREGKKRWGEKTPTHAFYLKHIFQLFPQARVIGMHRDAKAVVASYLKRPDLPDDSRQILIQYEHTLRAYQKYNGYILLVDYASFTKEPRKILKQICSYIEEPFEERMLNPGIYTSSYDDYKGTKIQKSQAGIVKTNEEKWKEVLDEPTKKLIEYVTEKKGNLSLKDRTLYKLKSIVYKLRWLKNFYGYESIYHDIVKLRMKTS